MDHTDAVQDQAKTDTVAMAMDTLAMGRMVEVEGSYDTRYKLRWNEPEQLNMFGGRIVSSQGWRQRAPPVDVGQPSTRSPLETPRRWPRRFVTWTCSAGAFVNPRATDATRRYQDFSVSTTALHLARRSPPTASEPKECQCHCRWQRVQVGDWHRARDFCGTIWPRNQMDLVP